MRKPYKRPFVAFTILAFVMFALFAASFVLLPLVGLQIDLYTGLIRKVYITFALFRKTFDFTDVLLSVSMIIAAVLVLFFLVLVFVALIGVKKKAGAKFLTFLLALLGIGVAYIGGVACIHNINTVQSINAQVPAWEGFIQYLNAAGGAKVLPAVFVMVMDVALLLFIVFTLLAIINAIKYSRNDLVKDEEVPAEENPEPEVIEEAPEVEEAPVFMPEPEDEEATDPANLSTSALAAIIKDVVRDIVRDELERNNLLGGGQPANDSHTDNHSVVGATFGGPLIVQYFNGGFQSAPAPAQPAPAEEPKEEPKEEEPAPAEEPEPEPEPQPAPAPVVEEPAPAPAQPEEKEPKAPIIRIPFDERLLGSEKELQELYSELKNEILSYGVKSRVSSSGDTFRLHRKTYVKITVAGKSLKLYFALNPDDYRDSTIPVQDASEKGIYSEIPLVFKVKSPLSVRRCKQLIQDVMEKDNLEQGEIGTVNWIKELKAEMKARKNEKKD